MRALHICHKFSVLTETFVYDSIVELQNLGIDNHVITRRRVNPESRPFPHVHILWERGRFHPIRLLRRVIKFPPRDPNENVQAIWSRLRVRVLPLLRKLSADVIHAHFGPEGAMIAPVAARLGIPFIVTFYGYDFSKLSQFYWWRDAYQPIWQHAARVIALSEFMRGPLVELGCPESLISEVHLGRNLSQLPPPQARSKAARFISVGRLVEKKGHHDMLRAFAKAAAARPDLELKIVGDGPLFAELNEAVERLGLREKVALLGAMPADQVMALMQNSDAFLLTSKTSTNGDQEGTPTVLIEAQYLGLPCVSTTHAGIPEMIPPSNRGLLAAEGDIDAIADRILALSHTAPVELARMAQDGFRHVDQHYNLRTESKKLAQIYAEAKSGGRRRSPSPSA